MDFLGPKIHTLNVEYNLEEEGGGGFDLVSVEHGK